VKLLVFLAKPLFATCQRTAPAATEERARDGLRKHTDAGWNIGKVPYGYLAQKIAHPRASTAAQGLIKNRLILDPGRAPGSEQIHAWRTGGQQHRDPAQHRPGRLPARRPPGRLDHRRGRRDAPQPQAHRRQVWAAASTAGPFRPDSGTGHRPHPAIVDRTALGSGVRPQPAPGKGPRS
jgi:hypothetical protein